MDLSEVDKVREACKLVPLGVAVLVKPYERKRDGLIVLTESAKKEMDVSENRAVVIAVGPNAWHDEPSPRASPGDHVLMTKFAGALATGEDGQNYRVVNDQDIYLRLAGGVE